MLQDDDTDSWVSDDYADRTKSLVSLASLYDEFDTDEVQLKDDELMGVGECTYLRFLNRKCIAKSCLILSFVCNADIV